MLVTSAESFVEEQRKARNNGLEIIYGIFLDSCMLSQLVGKGHDVVADKEPRACILIRRVAETLPTK